MNPKRAVRAMEQIDAVLKADPSAYLDLIRCSSSELPSEVQIAMRKAYSLISVIREVNDAFREPVACPHCGENLPESMAKGGMA